MAEENENMAKPEPIDEEDLKEVSGGRITWYEKGKGSNPNPHYTVTCKLCGYTMNGHFESNWDDPYEEFRCPTHGRLDRSNIIVTR